MKKSSYIIYIILVAGLLLFLQSCKKNPDNTQTDFKKELLTIKGYMVTQQYANQFMLTFFKSIYDSTLINNGVSKIDSAIVRLNNQNDTLVIGVEYWHNSTTIWHHIDSYCHYRSGTYSFITDSQFLSNNTGNVKIVINKTFYFDSLTVNINNISISKTGLSANGNQTFKVIFDNIIMDGTYAGKFTYQFDAIFNYELFKDPSSPYIGDNDYLMFYGDISGNTETGTDYQIQIDSDTAQYKIDFRCKYTIEGKSIINMAGGDIPINQAVLDFISDDGCANYYTITFPDKFSTKSVIE